MKRPIIWYHSLQLCKITVSSSWSLYFLLRSRRATHGLQLSTLLPSMTAKQLAALIAPWKVTNFLADKSWMLITTETRNCIYIYIYIYNLLIYSCCHVIIDIHLILMGQKANTNNWVPVLLLCPRCSIFKQILGCRKGILVPAESLKPCDTFKFNIHCDGKDWLEEVHVAYGERGLSLFCCKGWWALDLSFSTTYLPPTQLCTTKSKKQPSLGSQYILLLIMMHT